MAAVVALLCFMTMPGPAVAEPLPDIEKVMTANERQLFTDAVRDQLTTFQTDSKASLAVLDQLLARDPEPTQFRGYIQLLRAAVLTDLNKSNEAMAAADESVRLLSGYSAPLFAAVNVYAYADHPADAADFLLRASQIDPDATRTMSDYDVDNLISRLSAAKQYRRRDAVAAKLLEIGWKGETLSSRSDLALTAIMSRAAQGNVAGARALVPQVVNPWSAYRLLADNRYREIWPDIERWGGPRLQRQWQLYLTEARARFLASKAPEDAVVYGRALDAARDHDQIISDLLPLFSGKLDRNTDFMLVYALPYVARALAVKGRWDEMDALFERAALVWPVGSDPNALNISANYGKLLVWEGKYAEALKHLDASIADSNKWSAEVGGAAIGAMHLYRACALHKLGRESEAAFSASKASGLGDPERVVTLEFCLDNKAGARAVVLKALDREDQRSSAILILQKRVGPSCESQYCAQMDKMLDDLVSDQTMIDALRKYGRVMPFALSDGAPQAHPPAGK